ncbi:MAG: mechanosensitive ion channel family protein [bacterium]|nr:mechanosensitive ion channel family protein [bacterium]
MKIIPLEHLLKEFLPAIFFNISFLDIWLWQWIFLGTSLILSCLLSWCITKLSLFLLLKIFVKRFPLLNKERLKRVAAPMLLGFFLILFTGSIEYLNLDHEKHLFLATTIKIGFIFVLTWLTFRIIDVVSQRIATKLEIKNNVSIVTILPLARRVLKSSIFILALLTALQNLGFDVTALIAGLGVGGIAIALSAQKTLENLFGGAMLVLDQPVRVGDLCNFGDKTGTVEEIGLRSTKIRTMDETLISVPNSNLSQLQIENVTSRPRIRFNCMLELRYETSPDQLRFILIELRKLLYGHPSVDNDPARVRFVGFGTSSLNVEINCYILTKIFYDFTAIREDLLLTIMELIEKSGSGFAFPSQTTYLANDPGLSPIKTKAAEKIVSDWRDKSELCLPEFSPQQINKLQNSVSYPPKGSVLNIKDS